MGLRSTNEDARMAFQYRLEIPGVNAASIAECGLPDSEFDEAKYPNGNVDVKQPGRRKFTDLMCKRILSSVGPDLSVHDWHDSCGDPETGVALRPSAIKKDGFLLVLDSDGATVIEKIKLAEVWPKKITGMKFNGTSEVTYEEITFSIGWMKRKAP